MKFEERTLASLSKSGRGEYGINASAVPYSSDLYTYLRITDINDDGTLNKNDLKSVCQENAEKYILNPNDIVFARTGASTGRNYFYDGSDGILVYAGFLIKFSLDENKVNPKYIKYYCLSKKFKNWVNSFNTGSTRGNINAQTFGEMKIDLPLRKHQDNAVNILSALDDKIELNNAINENLHKQVKALFKAWFVDYIPFDGVLPNDWIGTTLGSIVDITSGKRPFERSLEKSQEFSIPLVGAASIMGFTNAVLYNEKILVTGRVGTHGVIQRFSNECWTSDNTLVIKSPYYEFVYQVLHNIDYSNMNRGSTQPLITQSDLKKVPIFLPTTNILDKFESIAGVLMAKYEKNVSENDKLVTLRDTLLPKLMSGEIDVSDVEI